jgi:hypothetical protein
MPGRESSKRRVSLDGERQTKPKQISGTHDGTKARSVRYSFTSKKFIGALLKMSH